MSENLHKRPLYLQLSDLLTKKIVTGEWPKGHALPNEFELSHQLEVSIDTLRKAIDVLVSERLVYRKQGKGTFVLDRLSAEMRNIFDPIRNWDGSFVDWQWKLLSVDTGPSSPKEQLRLSLAEGEWVTRIERLRLIGNRACKFERATVPAKRFEAIEGLAAQDTGIVLLAYQAGIQLGFAEERVQVRAATAKATKSLDIPVGQPVLRLCRLVHDAQGKPIEWRIAECNLQTEFYHAPNIKHSMIPDAVLSQMAR